MFKNKRSDIINANEKDYLFVKNKEIYTKIFHDQVRERDGKIIILGFKELTSILEKLKGYEKIVSKDIKGIRPIEIASIDIEDRLEFIRKSTKKILGINEEDGWDVFFNSKGLFIPSFNKDAELRIRRYNLNDKYILSIFNDFIKEITYDNDTYIINLKITGIAIAKKYSFTMDNEQSRIIFNSNLNTKQFLRACLEEKGVYREMYVQNESLYVVI